MNIEIDIVIQSNSISFFTYLQVHYRVFEQRAREGFVEWQTPRHFPSALQWILSRRSNHHHMGGVFTGRCVLEYWSIYLFIYLSCSLLMYVNECNQTQVNRRYIQWSPTLNQIWRPFPCLTSSVTTPSLLHRRSRWTLSSTFTQTSQKMTPLAATISALLMVDILYLSIHSFIPKDVNSLLHKITMLILRKQHHKINTLCIWIY